MTRKMEEIPKRRCSSKKCYKHSRRRAKELDLAQDFVCHTHEKHRHGKGKPSLNLVVLNNNTSCSFIIDSGSRTNGVA